MRHASFACPPDAALPDRHRGARAVRRGVCADGIHGPGSQLARRTGPRLSARKLACTGNACHDRRLLRRLALVRRRRASESRLGLRRVPEPSLPGPHGDDPRCGADARARAGPVLARALLGQLLPQPPMVWPPRVLGAPAAATLSAAEPSSPVATAGGASPAPDRACPSATGSPVAADDPAGAFATRRRATTIATIPTGRPSGGTSAAPRATVARDGASGARRMCVTRCSAC